MNSDEMRGRKMERESGRISAAVVELAGRYLKLREITPARYASMKYPKL